MFANLSQTSLTALSIASTESQGLGHYYIGVEHIFIGLCTIENSELARVMSESRFDAADWRRYVRERLETGTEPVWGRRLIVTPRAERVVKIAGRVARHFAAGEIEPLHLFIAMLIEGQSLPVRLLLSQQFDINTLKQRLVDVLAGPGGSPQMQQPAHTPALNKFGNDLTYEARQGKLSPLVGREEELKKIVRILLRRTKSNPLLIGEAGVGKSCLAYGLAQYIASAEALNEFKDKRIIELNMTAVVAGTKYRGDLEERLQQIIDEVRNNTEVILFLDEIHTCVGAGGGTMDAANILKPALANGEIRCIGATTTAEYYRHIKSDPALERRFEVVTIAEPTLEQTVQILAGLRATFETHHRVTITEEAIVTAVKLADRYLTGRHFPDKALDIIDMACVQVRLGTLHEIPATNPDAPRPVVDKSAIVQIISQRADQPIPESVLSRDDAEKALHLAEHLKQHVVGQDEAVEMVARVVQAHQAGLSDGQRPIAVFLFVGPTGVGKTELARALALTWFGSERKLIRLDMSEFAEPHTVSRLVGAPPGYVGYTEEGQLTAAIDRHPYSIVLLDEIEKAHPEILKLFLQVFDAGRLTDAKGRLVNFTNTIIVMTSNVGSAAQFRSTGFTTRPDDQEQHEWEAHSVQIKEAVNKTFTPEFRNRFDAVIVFHPITSGHALRQILILLMDETRRHLRERQIGLEVDEEVLNLLLREGYSRDLGARELRRTRDRLLRDPLAEHLLLGDFSPGDTVRATLAPGNRVSFLKVGSNKK